MRMNLPDNDVGPGETLGIACGTGGFKGVFLTGVLQAFEEHGLQAEMYAAASSSVLPAGLAALGMSRFLGAAYWHTGLSLVQRPSLGMSAMILLSIGSYGPLLRNRLFRTGAPRFLVAANRVANARACDATQGAGARRLGRRLLLSASRADSAWADENLQLCIFDTRPVGGPPGQEVFRLDPGNIEAVAYGSTRMLHAWDTPAWVGPNAFVDAAYTCACPALPLAERGCRKVLALVNEPGPPYLDLFGARPMPERWAEAHIQVVQPDIDPAELGVEYTSATSAGLEAVFRHGLEVGRRYCESH